MYKYLISVASIVAVIVIIVAGIQWVTSGGNSETIGSAKNRIGGAIIGLFIGYMSYFILYTINPAIVNFRLPQTWLVRPQNLMPEFCREIPKATEGKIKFSTYAGSNDQTSPFDPKKKDNKYDWIYSDTSQIFYCGSRLLAESGGDSTCVGDVCQPENGERKTCFKASETEGYRCGDVRIGGNISYSSLAKKCGGFWELSAKKVVSEVADVFSQWGCPPVADTGLVLVCEDQEKLDFAALEPQPGEDPFSDEDGLSIIPTTLFRPKRSSQIDIGVGKGERTNHYRVELSSSAVRSKADQLCGVGKTRGFVLRASMIKENVVDVDEGYGHLIGRNGVDLGDAKFWRYATKIDKKYLFSLDEIERGGVRMDFDAASMSYGAELSRYKRYAEGQ